MSVDSGLMGVRLLSGHSRKPDGAPEIRRGGWGTGLVLGIALLVLGVAALRSAEPLAPWVASPAVTTLANPNLRYTVPEKGYVVLHRGDLEAVVVDNRAVDDALLPGHAAGYHGIAALRHARQPRSLYVPAYAGLNFEHIHDGTVQSRWSSIFAGCRKTAAARRDGCGA